MSRNVAEQKPKTMATFPNRKRTRSQQQWQHIETVRGADAKNNDYISRQVEEQTPTTMAKRSDMQIETQTQKTTATFTDR
jgi:hypothetical protein